MDRIQAEIRRVRVKRGDLVVCRVDEKDIHGAIGVLRPWAVSAGVEVLLMAKGASLRTVSEEEMRRAGWVRAPVEG